MSFLEGVLLTFFALQDPQEPATPKVQEFPSRAEGWQLELLPERYIYRPYLADPRQSRTGTKVSFPLGDRRDDSVKIENTLGSHRALALWTDPQNPDEEAQLLIEAAVFSRFDIREHWDLDAADYRFGFPFVYRDGDVSFKAHFWHLTSHLGDEFISREGRERDSYHLDEFAFATIWEIDPHYRVYLELGAGFYTGPETQSGRAQTGAEWTGERWFGQVAPFAAMNLETRNEIDWGWNAAAMGGLMIIPKSGGNGLRLFIEYYRGHDRQTQFKSEPEHAYSVGLAADL